MRLEEVKALAIKHLMGNPLGNLQATGSTMAGNFTHEKDNQKFPIESTEANNQTANDKAKRHKDYIANLPNDVRAHFENALLPAIGSILDWEISGCVVGYEAFGRRWFVDILSVP